MQKQFWRMNSISKKLLVPMSAFGVALILVFVFIAYPMIHSSLKDRTLEIMTRQSDQTIDRINYSMKQYELYCNSISNDEILHQLLENYLEHTNEQNKELVNNALSGYMSHFSDITAINLVLEDHVFNHIGSRVDFMNVSQADWYQEYISNSYSRFYSPLVTNFGEEEGDDGQGEGRGCWRGRNIFVAFPFENQDLRGHLFLMIPFSIFRDSLDIYQEIQLDYMVLGKDDKPFFTYSAQEDGGNIPLEALSDPMKNNSYQHQLIIEHSNGFYIVSYSDLGGWKLVLDITERYIRGGFADIQNYIIFLLFLLVLLFIFTVVILVSKHMKPLRYFTEKMEEVGGGNLDIAIDISTGDELERLGQTFGRMQQRIKVYMNNQIEQDRREKKMEYALVLAQVDPHFIYKTLNIITYLAMKKETDRLIEVNQALINILKDRLRIDKINVFDSLEQELELIQSYLVIQRVRYGDRIRFEYCIPEELKQVEVPKNIIQPFIENAVFHGLLLNMDENQQVIGGMVRLSVEREEDLVIRVQDDGVGMDEDRLREYFVDDNFELPERGKHVGIKSIRQRLNYLYGNQYSLQVKSKPHVGTEIILKLRMVES